MKLPIQDSLETETSKEQKHLENECLALLQAKNRPIFDAIKHKNYVFCYFSELPSNLVALDASQSWIIFWSTNSLHVMGDKSILKYTNKIVDTIASFQENGAFAGGVGQNAHVASTYASIMSLALTRDFEAWMRLLNPKSLLRHFLKLKHQSGGFRSNLGGEIDIRGTYCTLVTASILNILTPELTNGVLDYICSCQSYEGGFGGSPGNEAHAGYTYCALAALAILVPINELHKCINLESCLEWLSARQYQLEGGFSGRTNKLVDACYSYWVGATIVLINCALGLTECTFDQQQLENFILTCCQIKFGGIRDKPGTKPDAYHTNYGICGLSMCQYTYKYKGKNGFDWHAYSSSHSLNTVQPVNPVYGVPLGVAEHMRHFFETTYTSNVQMEVN